MTKPMTNQELCQWLRDHSSGVYRPSADAADLIEGLEKAVKDARALAEEYRLLYEDERHRAIVLRDQLEAPSS